MSVLTRLTVFLILYIFNCDISFGQQTNVIALNDYENMKLNSNKPLIDLDYAEDYDQLLSEINLLSSLGKSCSNDPVTGKTCRYSSQSLYIQVSNGQLSLFDLLDSSNYISYNGVNISVGDSKTVLQNLFPNAYGNEKVVKGQNGQNRNALIMKIGDSSSISSIRFIFDTNNQIEQIRIFYWLG